MDIVTEINTPNLHKGKIVMRKESGVVVRLELGPHLTYKFFIQIKGDDRSLVHWDSGWVLARSLNEVRRNHPRGFASLPYVDCAQLWLTDAVEKYGADKIKAKLDKALKVN